MTPLRQKMIRELELHRKSPRTIEAYVTAVAQLARHYGRSPDAIAIEEIRDFLHHLISERKVAFSTCNQKLAGIRFLYRQVLGQEEFSLRVPAKRSGRLPEPLSRSEIAGLLDATQNSKHRVLLMTAYGGGLRVSELVHLLPRDIHSQRMLIRVNQGKGRKDRYTLLSPRLLEGKVKNVEPILPRSVSSAIDHRSLSPWAESPTESGRILRSPSARRPVRRMCRSRAYLNSRVRCQDQEGGAAPLRTQYAAEVVRGWVDQHGPCCDSDRVSFAIPSLTSLATLASPVRRWSRYSAA